MKATKKPSKRRSLNVVIPLVVYPFDVMFSLGQTDEELAKSLEKYSIKWDEVFKLKGTGRCVSLDTNQTVIRLDAIPESCADYGTLAHEIFHATDQILGKVGMQLMEGSDEAYAYLIGYITKEIYKRF